MLKRILEKKRDDGSPIYRIDRRSKKGIYFINPDTSQAKFISQIALDGFVDLPTGLYANGFGITQSGYYLLAQLHAVYGDRLRLSLSAHSPTSIRRQVSKVHVTFNHDDLKRINEVVREIKHQRKREIDSQVQAFLSDLLPEDFNAAGVKFTSYRPGTLASMLDDPAVIENLSDKDRTTLQKFYPEFIGGLEFSLRSGKNIRFITEGLEATQTIYLAKVVEDYEKKLNSSATESTWQSFLRSHILLLLNSYSVAIEKQSVDIDGKFPDFMLVDPYGYLDIYEIKKPQTKLLTFDQSRSNYYWDVEACKAISQVEKYIDQVAHQRLEIADKVRRKKHVDIKIVRPRGYVIVGRRSDLRTEEMAEDFRILNDSLKNIDIIFYDDLLDNLKSLLSRFEVEKKATKAKGRAA